jgi:hypothetical protein
MRLLSCAFRRLRPYCWRHNTFEDVLGIDRLMIPLQLGCPFAIRTIVRPAALANFALGSYYICALRPSPTFPVARGQRSPHGVTGDFENILIQ